MRKSCHSRSRPYCSCSIAAPSTCSTMTSRAFGVTMSRSGARRPCATSRAFSWSTATAGTSCRIRQSAALMSSCRPPLLRDAQDVGEPRALDVVRHDRQRRGGRHAAVDAADARVVGVAEIREPRGALAQRELERRHGQQRRSQPENLQQLTRRAVGGDHAFADTVGEQRGFGVIAGRKTGHDDAYSATPGPVGHPLEKRCKSLLHSESGRSARSMAEPRRLQDC